MTGASGGAGKGETDKGDAGKPTAKTTRSAKLPLERTENLLGQAGTSHVPVRPAPLEDMIEKLVVPVATGTDAALTEAELESHRQNLHQEALAMSQIRREFEITFREYNKAHGLTPIATHPSRIEDVRKRGRCLNVEIARDGRSSSSKTPSHMSAKKPKYSSRAKTLRAAEAVIHLQRLYNF